MVKLSDFIGEIIKDLASARTYADYSAAAAGEVYHADPFIKNLPIPHYIIDEAEIDVPVVVIGVSTQSEDYSNKKELLNNVLKAELGAVLLETFKWNYIHERIKLQDKNKDKPDNSKKPFVDYKNNFEFSSDILAAFNDCIKEIVVTVTKKFAANLELYNYAVLKLLEITESFGKELKYAINHSIRMFSSANYKKGDYNPFLTKESVNNAIAYVSNIVFFNFMKIMQSDSSVHIDVATTKMNEYQQKDCLMHIKLKVKEQDLNLVVEKAPDSDKEKRYLSLT